MIRTGVKLLLVLLLLAVVSAGSFSTAQSQSPECKTVFIPPDTFRTVCEDEPPPGGCIPGTIRIETIFVPVPPRGCAIVVRAVDICTGEILWTEVKSVLAECLAPPDGGHNPCTTITITPGSISCGSEWLVAAQVSFPATYLDLRPYPATLVRWPSAARCGGLPPVSGSGRYDYVPYGGGSPEDPVVGDWRDLRLTLTLQPAGPMYFGMPQMGALVLPDVGETGAPTLLSWELPSHPEAGGSVLAGSVPGLEELPSDLPLFRGAAASPYRLFWRLTYQRYIRECAAGPEEDTGRYRCKTRSNLAEKDGHWEYRWEPRRDGGEITPGMVVGLPPGLAADLNGDGVPDAFWNQQVVIRRMDEAGRVDHPVWSGSWSWGGAVYWAVREGQGQIGWP